MKLNWGSYIFIFIIFFLSLCTIFIIFSLRQNNDLVTDDYYNKGADYSTELAVINRSSVYNDSVSVFQSTDNLTITFSPTLSQEISSLNLWFYRPSGQEEDYRSDFALNDDSVSIARDKLSRGRFILKIFWTMDDTEYMIEEDIFIN